MKSLYRIAFLALVTFAASAGATPLTNEPAQPTQPKQTCLYSLLGTCVIPGPVVQEEEAKGCVPTLCKCRCPKTQPAL